MAQEMNREKKSHREIGEEMELFRSMEEAPGMPFFLPKGMVIRNEIENYWKREHRKAGYQEIKTPIMMKQGLWEQSGHWEHYHENMYFSEVDDQRYAIKPMNCPGAILLFNSKKRSYRELPLRYAELGLVHRHELSGSLNGLLRVRSFTQDDAHLFVTYDQVESEIDHILSFVHRVYSHFGFSYKVELSTRPETFMGDINDWDKAETSLENVLKQRGIPYQINEGDGAFYGPKIDFHILDSLGRSWQCGTVQLDFMMPEKFECSYVGADNQLHRPVMIHRAIFGSIERFMAILIEHYEGEFPLWLAPVQVKLLPISDNQHSYVDELKSCLEAEGVRVEVDNRVEKLGLKIREATVQKVPYMCVIGEKEEAQGVLSVRKRKEGNIGEWTVEELLKQIKTN